MKLFVISDTHKNINRVKEVYNKLKDIDYAIHLGDYEEDAKQISLALGVNVLSVPGNMDGSNSSNDYKTLDTEYGKLLLTHGHMDNVKYSYERLLYRAEDLGCKAVLFGHTHIPLCRQIDGIYLINPGSISAPRDGSNGSYAVLTTTSESLNCAIVYYKSHESAKSLKRCLRDLLNHSDRF